MTGKKSNALKYLLLPSFAVVKACIITTFLAQFQLHSSIQNKMRITRSTRETTNLKQTLYRDLLQECQLSTTSSRLSEKLKRKIEEIGKDARKDVVGQTEEGCAPLFLACKNGSADVVEYLLSTCDADIEQRGVFEVAEEEVKHSVTPLWCAAVAGRLSVVKVQLSTIIRFFSSLCNESVNEHFLSNLCPNCIFKWT